MAEYAVIAIVADAAPLEVVTLVYLLRGLLLVFRSFTRRLLGDERGLRLLMVLLGLLGVMSTICRLLAMKLAKESL